MLLENRKHPQFGSLTKEDYLELIDRADSLSTLYELLGYSRDCNGNTAKNIREYLISDLGILDPASYFRSKRKKPEEEKIRKSVGNKECPVCGKWFESYTYRGKDLNIKEKTTCGRACSNTYFRSGKNHGNYSGKDESYRTICFAHHKKQCVVCGERKIVAVHHLDENRENNSPENLVPLCPTHHQYWHSRYKSEVEPIVLNYIKEFLGGR